MQTLLVVDIGDEAIESTTGVVEIDECLAVDLLGLEGLHEAFGFGVVEGVSGTAHADLDLSIGEALAICDRGVLHAFLSRSLVQRRCRRDGASPSECIADLPSSQLSLIRFGRKAYQSPERRLSDVPMCYGTSELLTANDGLSQLLGFKKPWMEISPSVASLIDATTTSGSRRELS